MTDRAPPRRAAIRAEVLVFDEIGRGERVGDPEVAVVDALLDEPTSDAGWLGDIVGWGDVVASSMNTSGAAGN